MSTYQYYKFERIDGYLDTEARQFLRDISSRAKITSTTFQVEYSYSDLKAEPRKLMLDHFDIGLYFANWGSIDVYIKVPAATLPDAMMDTEIDGFYAYQTKNWQLLVFSLEEHDKYFDEEYADVFFEHLVRLRSSIINGDWRLLFFMWLKAFENMEVSAIPLIKYDFTTLNDELKAFATIYEIPLVLIKALEIVLDNYPSHDPRQSKFHFEDWLNQLSDTDKNQIISAIFKQGQLTSQQAIKMTSKAAAPKQETYQYWLTPEVIQSYVEQAKARLLQAQSEAEAKKLATQKAEKEKILADIYIRRELYWSQVYKQTNRACASGYTQASRDLHLLSEAYQLKGDSAAFDVLFKAYYSENSRRRSLIFQLRDLL